jgi:dTMP kinase
LLDPDHPVGPVAELFFYLAARADLVQTVIQPALAMGRVVLSDRFALSTEAYQMAGRGLDPAMVRAANEAATHGVRPDLTLILILAPELGQARQIAAGKRQDRLDRESLDFHRRVLEYYLAVQGRGVRHLDARLPRDQLLQAAWAEIRRAAPETFRSTTG